MNGAEERRAKTESVSVPAAPGKQGRDTRLHEEVVMKVGRIEFTVLVSALVVTARLGGAMGADQKDLSQARFAWKDGAEVYTKICALCHETSVGPTIRGRSHARDCGRTSCPA